MPCCPPPELPPPSEKECVSLPLDQCSSEEEEVPFTEAERGRYQPAPVGMLHLPSALLWLFLDPLHLPFHEDLPF